MEDVALVLGGGGLWGMAWMIGLLAGFAERGLDVRRTGMVVGTSAGSVIGSQILSGADFAELVRRQTEPELQALEVSIPLHVMAAAVAATGVLDGIDNPYEKLRALGRFALEAKTTTESAHRNETVRTRLVSETWPKIPLRITAVDVLTGESCYFDKDSGVELVDAVAASCAVPKIWPTVTINGRKYMDGGVRSLANAHLARGARRILVVSPYSSHSRPFLGPTLQEEVDALEAAGSHVVVVEADAAAVEVAGSNTLDPSTRSAAAQAGLAQAEREAKRLISMLY